MNQLERVDKQAVKQFEKKREERMKAKNAVGTKIKAHNLDLMNSGEFTFRIIWAEKKMSFLRISKRSKLEKKVILWEVNRLEANNSIHNNNNKKKNKNKKKLSKLLTSMQIKATFAEYTALGFRSQLEASRRSIQIEELGYNETVCGWLYIYIYVCVCVLNMWNHAFLRGVVLKIQKLFFFFLRAQDIHKSLRFTFFPSSFVFYRRQFFF